MTQRKAETRGGLLKFSESIGLKTAGLLMAGFAIASCTNSDGTNESHQSYNAKYAVDDSATLDECPNPDQAAIDGVETLFTSEHTFDESSANEPLSFFEVKQRIAAEHGLTIYDYAEELLSLKQDAYGISSKITFSEYLKKSNEFTRKYGVEIVIGKDFVDIYDEEDSELSRKNLNTLVAKQSLLAITDAIGELPVEFMEHIQLKKIVLLQINQSSGSGAIYGYMYPELDGVIYIDPTYRNSEDYDADVIRKATLHEIFHQWDAQVCGTYDMDIDGNYDKLNPGAIYGAYRYDSSKKGSPGIYISAEDAYREVEDLQIEKFDANQRNDFLHAAAIDTKIANIKNRIIVNRYYGFSSIDEDKGTMGENILDPYSYTVLLDEQSTIFRKKSAYLIARLREDFPKLVNYFAAISNIYN